MNVPSTNRLPTHNEDVLKEIRELKGDVIRRFDTLTSRFDALTSRFDTLTSRFDTLTSRFDTLTRSVQSLEQSNNHLASMGNPLSNPQFRTIPTIGDGSSNKLGTNNSCTYTWAKYYGNDLCLLGAAHCALPYSTLDSNKLFVELPAEITALGVKDIKLVKPYDGKFQNWDEFFTLPSERDLIMIHVEASPPQSNEEAIPVQKTPNKNKGSAESLTYRSIVGKPHGLSAVTSKDGIIVVETDENSVGDVTFFLDRGEPGDSGTLFYMKNSTGDGEWEARAIFLGIEPLQGPQHGRRGRAAIPPDPSVFESFDVIDSDHIHGQKLEIGDYAFNTDHPLIPTPEADSEWY